MSLLELCNLRSRSLCNLHEAIEQTCSARIRREFLTFYVFDCNSPVKYKLIHSLLHFHNSAVS